MRLLIVSNRLPVTVAREAEKLSFRPSVGGLVTGFNGYVRSLQDSTSKVTGYLWAGWPGAAVSDQEKTLVRKRLLKKFNCYPVFIPVESMDEFYLGFCNSTIWPLFHYFPSNTVYNAGSWTQYERVNEIFRDAVLEVAEPEDIIWVQDYHLMLLPGLLRKELPSAKIGFFLHIPFPAYEIFRLLPNDWRRNILNGLLGADVVGFHTHDYTEYFLRCVARILGFDNDMGRIILGERMVKADTFPMGIDFGRFHEAASRPATRRRGKALRRRLASSKVVLSIDRLDYTKGTLHRLRAYELFLEETPEWRGQVVLVLVVVPSRIGVEDYQRTKQQIDELVGKINGVFGSVEWTPIVYQYTALPFSQIVDLYGASDVALVTPLRDGMNLIAKEYLASRANKTGVLIISEMAGAAKELGEAVIVNPNDIEGIAGALKLALTMPEEEQVTRNEIMQNRLRRYDVVKWAADFINALLRAKAEQANLAARLMTPELKGNMVADFLRAERRLFLLDYEDTLIPTLRPPQTAKPGGKILTLLDRLAQDPRNEVIVISRLDKETLQSWFGHLRIGLMAEQGVWIKEALANWEMVHPLSNDWKRAVVPILEMHVDRLPGSLLEEREYSVVWNYRNADTELASVRASELMDELVAFTANADLQVTQGTKDIQVRSASVNKGAACLHLMGPKRFDFVLAAGDDVTDEELFKAVAQTAYTIKVGLTQSSARFNLSDSAELQRLLERLSDVSEVPSVTPG
ncbi:MAG: bifunctional alpha,alpha-trehalose-phosphate synthase (UDP-forming)/trehalose-phosphatase [Dehalococcoidia bacterium]|nr:bifunctional alpha,alpha-trehalose-phosphate synthase (UDP-forming)/trehalose-phosphatase [Dehalococcoidia bacterium]